MTGSLARPAAAGQILPATPALLPSKYLVANLACSWWRRRPWRLAGWCLGRPLRLGVPGPFAAAGGVTGALALLLTGRLSR